MNSSLNIKKTKRKNFTLLGIASKNIKARREELGMSGATFKCLTALNPEEYESGKNDMVLTTLGLFAEKLATAPSNLLQDKLLNKAEEKKETENRYVKLIKELNQLLKEKNKEIELLKLKLKKTNH